MILICLDRKYVNCSMPKITGCPSTSGPILQYTSQHAFLAIPSHNPLWRETYATYPTMCHANLNKAERAQTFDNSLMEENTFKCKFYVIWTATFCAAACTL